MDDLYGSDERDESRVTVANNLPPIHSVAFG